MFQDAHHRVAREDEQEKFGGPQLVREHLEVQHC